MNFLLLCIAILISLQSAWGRVIPENVVDDLRKGYSQTELQLLDADTSFIRELVFRGKKPPSQRKPIYLVTAGAPGARKSTILEKYLHTQPEYQGMVYVDPDQRGIRFMSGTYCAQSLNNYKISQFSNYREAQKSAYDYWRAGSNYIANTLLNEAIAGKYDIAHGSTLTGPFSGALLKSIHAAGYRIIMILCGAEDTVRSL